MTPRAASYAIDAAARPAVDCRPAGAGPRATAELVRPAVPPFRGLRATLTFDAAAQPFVQFWSDPRPRRNVLAIEPVTSDRAEGRSSAPGPVLEPGARWRTSLKIRFDHP